MTESKVTTPHPEARPALAVRRPPHSLRDYLRVAFRRKWLIIVPVLMSVLAIPVLIHLVPPRYVATAMVRRRDLAIVRAATRGVADVAEANISVQTLRDEILSWPHLRRVIQRLKMDVDLKSPEDWYRKYEELSRRIQIRAGAQGRGVHHVYITVRGNNPSEVQRLANAIGDVYVEESKGASQEEIQKAVEFLEKQVRDSRADLDKAERALEEFTRKDMADIPQVRKNLLERILAFQLRRDTDTLALESARHRLQTIEEQLKTVPRTVATDIANEKNPEYDRLEAEIQRLKEEESRLLLTMKPEHPYVQAKRAEIAAAEARLAQTPRQNPSTQREVINPLYGQLLQDRVRTQQEVTALEASIRQAEANIRSHEAMLKTRAPDEKRYEELVRAKAECERLFNTYAESYARIQEQLKTEILDLRTNVDFVYKALEPPEPEGPDPVKLAALCLVVGAALAMALVFAVEFFDHSLRGPEDAVEVLQIPALGSITKIVTADERAAARRRRFTVGASLGAFLAAALMGALIIGYFRPDSVRGAWERLVRVSYRVLRR